MGQKSKIEWTNATWNPLRGCSRVSKGCENCYAEQVARRFSGPGQPYEGLVRIGRDGKPKAQWNGTVRVVPERFADPLRWTKPRLVFVNSMSDLFHEEVSFLTMVDVFAVMAASPQHTFQVLTKRPDRMLSFLRGMEHEDNGPARTMRARLFHRRGHGVKLTRPELDVWPLPNVWLGVSVEDQESADARIPLLLECPAAVRWVSYEPALGPVDFHEARYDNPNGGKTGAVTSWAGGLDWIVVGGESGPGARPFDLAWARSTIEQGRATGTPVFVKQLGSEPVALVMVEGEKTPTADADARAIYGGTGKRGDWSDWPEDLRVREWPEARP